MIIPAGNCKYHLQVHGQISEKPTLLLFHGFMGSGRAFDMLLPRLKDFSTPVTIDLKGHGKSSKHDSPDEYDTETQVSELESIIKRLQLPNLFLYGYSMGGRLALQLALKYPALFSGLILESTHCGISDPEKRNKRQQSDAERAKQIKQDFSSFLKHWASLPLFNAGESDRENQYFEEMSGQHADSMAASLLGFGAGIMPAVCSILNTFHQPVQLIAGQHDQKYVDKMGEMAQLFPSSKLEIVKGAAHRVHVDQPEQVTKILKSFITKHHV